ncbi:hypothetical protein H8356DRAFT_1436943 [Neocallimastix lanati (nom. inval.)]|nr:hypothetical protein H8356DRAFT_1436943 [Neocallimastix sp. JGI-2020a]
MSDQLEISVTNKEKNQIIVNRKYKFNLWYITNNTKIFKCTKYKTVKKCKSYIILNDNNKVIKYENKHTHPGKEYDASVSIVKHKMKNEIRKTSIPFDINPKHIYNEISEEIGLICPEYNSIKSQISRYIKKQLPPDISKFNEISDKSEYYINERDENFMIYKNSNIIIFQSSFPIPNRIVYKIQRKYVLFITRVFAPEINSFYTTSLSILNNKEQATYELLFEVLKKNESKYNNNIIVTPKILRCDFEKSISNASIKIFHNITIKYCVWHYKRSLETYLYKYDIQYWNYYNDINQIKNNASESFNNYLKKLFYKKPSLYELTYHLKREESLSYNNYKRKIEGESKLIDKKCDKNDIIDLCYKCL